MANILEFHILQAFPTNCLNRDDTNSVKTVEIGGVTRTRISSQCFKRAVREQLRADGVHIGTRSRLFAETAAEDLKARYPQEDADKITEASAAFFKAASNDKNLKTLLFYSRSEIEAAEALIEKAGFDPKKAAKAAETFAPQLVRSHGGHDGLDIAAFGRMMAARRDFDVQAAVSVAHAYTTHRVLTGIDFFTAVDDLDTANVTGHIGTNEFSSGVYYRYLVIDLDLLAKNLGLSDVQETKDAVGALIHALFFAIPKARQRTMASFRAWEYAHIIRRTGQAQQCIFEKPVTARGTTGWLAPSVEALEADIARTRKLFGNSYGLSFETIFGNDDRSIDDLIEDVKENL